VTGRLVALDLPGGPGFVDALRRVWDRGDAAYPLDGRLPPAARDAALAAAAPSVVLDADGEHPLTGGRPVEPGDALVVTTSGTTGVPKAVVLTHAAVAASAEASSRRLGVTGDDHWLACLPLAHVGGLSVVTRALHTGSRLTVLPGFDAEAVMSVGATLVSLVPTTLRRVDASRFRCILLGGARPPADRPANTVTTYGMTETGSGVVYDGIPLDGVEVRIVDGEVQVRGPMLLRAYRDGTEPLVDGWLATGDLGRFQADGRLHVEGRRGDLVITGGENVWPGPVEDVLRRLAGVADVVVVGRPDPEWGQVVTAVFELEPGAPAPTLDTVRGAVREVLPAFCAPRAIEVVEGLPRTALGKVERHRLG
jgi:O-succinylbenzoic acid--CoA ligase